MAVFKMHCKDPWFSFIRQGVKPVEGRKKTHTYKGIKAGDYINFVNGSESCKVLVTEVRDYATIEDYFEDVTLEKALPGIVTLEEGLNIYYQWSSEQSVKQHGFLALFVKPVE